MNKKDIRAEFSRIVTPEDIGEGLERTISARPAELEALARRMKLPSIRSLSAALRVRPEGRGGYRVRGRLNAEVDQECVRTLEIFPATVTAEVDRLFVPADSPAARALSATGVTELDADAPDAPDIIAEEGIDLGELVSETLALSLDPWPKKPGTDYVDMEARAPETPEERAAEERAREERNPFSVLKNLKS